MKKIWCYGLIPFALFILLFLYQDYINKAMDLNPQYLKNIKDCSGEEYNKYHAEY